ncbi:hypothetical protein llap_357 [Limosa lapponica baueri]|uniref:Uncharacterized protein n=1 Tax=Limosa lapponica baueri TaxID=1758121 RepID=A0A2I0UTH6_LIMLA|nr:hypothetical protein llap_357 [Limosa lapponica baueri]
MINRNLRKFWIVGSSAYGQVLWDGSARLQRTGDVNSIWLSPYILVKQSGFLVNIIRYGEHQQQRFIWLSVGSVQSDVLNGSSLNVSHGFTNWFIIMMGLRIEVNHRREINIGQEEGCYRLLSFTHNHHTSQCKETWD